MEASDNLHSGKKPEIELQAAIYANKKLKRRERHCSGERKFGEASSSSSSSSPPPSLLGLKRVRCECAQALCFSVSR